MTLLRHTLAVLWRSDRVLTATGLLMLAVLVPMIAGLFLDPRTITGAPAWLKPAKFAISTAIYSFTLAWILAFLPSWPRVRAVASRGTAAVFVTEVAIISLQAWRGTTSHFNLATPLDAALFNVMGAAIVVQTMTAAGVAVALWRQAFADRALGWALRLGLTIAIVGASTGGLMTRPTGAQLAEVRAGRPLTIAGAHTVGGPDGGPGLPGTGWSVEHGDLRAAHFLGLHAMQALPVLALILRRRASGERRVRIIVAAGGSYLTLFFLLVWQALRGQSIVQPDLVTATALAIWAAATILAVWFAWTWPVRRHGHEAEWASL
jgi:hypothetical protein